MTSKAPPDGWILQTGTWGTDADRNESLHESGGASVELKATAVATKLLSAWFPVRGGQDIPYSAWTIVRATSIAGGDTVTVQLKLYDDDRSTLRDTITLINGTLTAANVWEYHGVNTLSTNTVRWGRFEISKAASSFTVYVDSVQPEKSPPRLYAIDAGIPQNLPNSTWTTIAYATPSAGSKPEVAWNVGPAYQAQIQVPGAYVVNAWAEVSGLGDGNVVLMRINYNGGSTFVYGTMVPAGAAGTIQALVADQPTQNTGDTIEIQLWQNTGGALSIDGAWLRLTRIPSMGL